MILKRFYGLIKKYDFFVSYTENTKCLKLKCFCSFFVIKKLQVLIEGHQRNKSLYLEKGTGSIFN